LIDQPSKKTWRYYDYGPKEGNPLVFLHGASGTAEVFFKQLLSLGPKGYRVISVQYPGYSSYARWIRAFDTFLETINVEAMHIFGTALGGYLGQCYAVQFPKKVLSLILCTSFSDTHHYATSNPFVEIFQWTPEFLLKRMLLSNLPDYAVESEIANSIDFMVEQLELIKRDDLASRLTLNCTVGPFEPKNLPLDQSKITIIDVLDDVVLPEKLRNEVCEVYPNARKALLKSGGNFPYLSRADEINMHIEVHLRAHSPLPELNEYSDFHFLPTTTTTTSDVNEQAQVTPSKITSTVDKIGRELKQFEKSEEEKSEEEKSEKNKKEKTENVEEKAETKEKKKKFPEEKKKKSETEEHPAEIEEKKKKLGPEENLGNENEKKLEKSDILQNVQ